MSSTSAEFSLPVSTPWGSNADSQTADSTFNQTNVQGNKVKKTTKWRRQQSGEDNKQGNKENRETS